MLGQTDGPWSKARAIEDALSKTDADILVIADADVWTDCIEAVENVETWSVPHRQIRRLNRQATEAVLAGAEPEGRLEEPAYRAHPGGGVVVIRREVWNEVPMDPRFTGWGHEDDAWGIALTRLVDLPKRGKEALWHLWHPPQKRRARTRGSQANLDLYHRYVDAESDPVRMRALLDEFKGGP